MGKKIFAASLLSVALVFGAEQIPIRGIVVASSKECFLSGEELANFSGVSAIGISQGACLEKKLLPFCTLESLSENTLAEIKTEIERCYRESGFPFIIVEIPGQEVTSGVVQVVVKESTLDQIGIAGNQWSSASLLRKQLRLEQGQPISQYHLFRALNVMNRNPFHNISATYSPGADPMTTDLLLNVQERRPLALYLGADDTGIRYTGQPRLFAGASWGNAFWVNHILTFQYTTSVDFHEFQSFTLEYLAPLYNGNILDIYGGYSSIYPEIPNVSTSHGYSVQASLRYRVPFAVRESTSQEAVFGFDFKRTNNIIQFIPIEFEPIQQGVNLTQFMAGYLFSYQTSIQTFQFRTEAFTSPGSFLPDQSNADYNDLRAGAKHHWFYFRSMLNWDRVLPQNFHFVAFASGQYSTNNLLPSEQFGLGGWNSVRGYRERQLSKESAVAATLEIHTPSLSLKNGWNDLLYGLVFADFGWGMNRTAIGTWEKYDAIAGVGPGIRIRFKDYLRIRADWGFRLIRIDHPHVDLGSFLHFSAVSTF